MPSFLEKLGPMKLTVSAIVVVILALVAPLFAESAELPVQGLESRVEFWKKVYTQYGENDVIIHDRIRPNLIYDIAARADQAEKMAAVEQALDEISGNLANPQQRSLTAQQIRTA